MALEPIGRATPASGGARARRPQTGFAVPESGERAEHSASAEASAAAQAPLLTLQGAETAQQESVADREAALQGDTLLGAMRGLQLAMLGGDPDQAAGALDRLAAGLPESADPGLNAVLRAIAQRAAVERARRE